MLVTDKNIDLKQALNYHQIMKFPITNRHYMQIFWLYIIMKLCPQCQLASENHTFCKGSLEDSTFYFISTFCIFTGNY